MFDYRKIGVDEIIFVQKELIRTISKLYNNRNFKACAVRESGVYLA